MTVSRAPSAGANLWYVLFEDEIQGPFPAKLITRFLILGRFELSTEISRDRRVWQPVSEYPELIPSELLPNSEGVIDQDRLLAARRWEDERIREERRHVDHSFEPAGDGADRRVAGDRRQEEESSFRRHVAEEADRAAVRRGERRFAILSILAVLALIGGVIGIALNETWVIDPGLRDCHVAARPGVNWNHCSRRGAELAEAQLSDATMTSTDLTSADLRAATLVRADMSYATLKDAKLSSANMNHTILIGADLRDADLTAASLDGANLSYADLRGAKITDAEITGAVFDRAIWLDGRICEELSRGECRQMEASPEIP